MTYKQWMKKVDDLVWQRVGCSVHDLPDCTYWDWYNDGVSPTTAAGRAIKNME